MADGSVLSRDTVFVYGGQPSVTYVDRSELDIERHLARVIAAPNQIVSLSGPTKCGKTVLCRRVLGEREYVWIEGGQIKTAAQVWDRTCYELNQPTEISLSDKSESKGEVGTGLKFILSATGSQLSARETTRTYKIDSMATALRHMLEHNQVLVIDDFHYPNEDVRTEFLRNVKGAVFRGLKVILLSVTHRAYDALKAEPELTGRFSAVVVPEWAPDDLQKIAQKGFSRLNVNCPADIVDVFTNEAQSSPFLMQRFCWEMCFDIGVDRPPDKPVEVPPSYPMKKTFARIAKDSGLPVYQKLVVGPQARSDRIRRPKVAGGDADIYEATLLAIAETGPLPVISYENIRTRLNQVLADHIPQKNEVTFALKQLALISRNLGTDAGLDWDGHEVNISDPYLRFFLRWQIRESAGNGSLFHS